MSDGFEATTNGVVASIDQDLARVLIGANEEEWFFPMQTLPAGTEVGSKVVFVLVDGRYAAHSLAGSRNTNRAIEDRLSRPLSLRKTADFRTADLAAELEDDE